MVDLLVRLGSVVLINIILSGDNAVVIALASRNLPGKQRNKAIFLGSALAVILRVLLVVIATLLLRIPLLQLIGGLALVYIGFHLLAGGDDDMEIEGNDNLWKAVKTILVADLIMSLDNVLAIAGVAQGHWGVLIFGLAVSVPLVILGASILSKLMNRFPIIVYIGAALIAYTAAEMMCSDSIAGHYLAPFALIIKIVVTAGVVGFGFLAKRLAKSKKIKADEKGSGN